MMVSNLEDAVRKADEFENAIRQNLGSKANAILSQLEQRNAMLKRQKEMFR